MAKTTLCWILLLLATMGIQGRDNLSSYPCPKECECYVRATGELVVDVFCNLRGPLDPQTTNFSIIQTDISSVLYINCDSLFDATLAENMFSNLHSFIGIKFEDCRFRYVPRHTFSGMSSLRLLIINNAYSPGFHPEALDNIPQLTHISILNSDMKNLPNLCHLSNLIFLNISNNAIQSLSDTGLVCENGNTLHNLTFLFIDFNRLTDVDLDIGQYVPNLKRYQACNNKIHSLKSQSLQNLPLLEYFDIGSNNISSIDDNVFRYNSNLQILGLESNPLKLLPYGIFHSLMKLAVLALSDTQVDDNVWQELYHLTSLIELQLGNNNISVVHKSVISKLKNVNYLDVSGNRIRKLEDNTFFNQYRLETLLLSKNRITRIERLAFNGLLNVTKLELQNNQIMDMHNESLHFLPNLHGLNMSFNQLTEIPMLNDLELLYWIDLRGNFIQNLTSSTFKGLGKLTGLNIMWNRIKYISRSVFTPLKSLDTLNLAHNKIQFIEESAFSGLHELAWVRLQYNELTDIPRMFTHFTSNKLINLDLSYNKIRGTINSDTFPKSLEILDLSSNKISNIIGYTFYKFENLRSVNLKNNMIKSLKPSALYVSSKNIPTPFIYLSGNRFVCDCKLKWLREKMDSSRPAVNSAIVPDLDVTLCVEGFRTKNTFLYKIDPKQMLCEYTDECPSPCHCCEFHCYCRYTCPDMCSCYRTFNYVSPNYVICSKNNFTQIPFNVPSIASHLYLDGNNFTQLEKHKFLDLYRETKYLYLNGSHITSIENRTFVGLKVLRTLFLNNNELTELLVGMFDGLENLLELNLEKNLISEIQTGIFNEMPKLSMLYLKDNLLALVPDSFFYFVSFLHDFTLSGNRWSCNCSFLTELVHTLFDMAANVSDLRDVQCAVETPNYTMFYNLNELNLQKMCPNISISFINITMDRNVTFQSVKRLQNKSDVIAFIIVIVSVCTIFIVLSFLFWKRDFVQLVLYTKFGCRFFQENDDFTKIYDAFISYSNFDENFVVHQLVPKLECPGYGFKLCVHYRDFPVGASIAETIVNSVESSRRTILVLSDNFLKSEWCQYEFQTAHHHVLRNKHCKLIVILRHEIDQKKLDPELRLYLKTRTYLKYGDPWFWDKLYYAMPNVRTTSQDQLLRQNHYDHTPESIRTSTPDLDLPNTVCGSLQDDEGYETPWSRPTSEINTMTKDSFSNSKLSSHSSNIYEEIT